MARAATSPELALYRTPGKWSKLRCAFLIPTIIYRARINQTFTTFDQILTVIYDGGTGTLENVLPDMEVWIGSTLDAHDKGICRLRDKDATHFYLSETSEITFENDDYVTILAGYGVWARPVRLVDGSPRMDEIAYTNQHTNWDPQPNMGTDRVLELIGASVSTSFDAMAPGRESFCPGSSISSYAWTCATASGSSGTTTATPTFTFDTIGNHLVYCTMTAANGKQFFGVRNVFVWDQDNPPPMALITNPGRCSVESGGWEIEITLFGDCDLSQIYDRAKVILFSEEYFGNTKSAIGPVTGSENIKFIGWMSRENNEISHEQGSVTFVAHGAAYWMTKIPSWPDGVELTGNVATSWTQVKDLTVDLGVYHFLRHRTTITRIMDVTLTGDTRLSNDVSSSAQNLWGQLQDMTWAQIYARPGVNALNQLSIQIHPCLIPSEDRDFPTVMAITKADIVDGIEFERSIVDDVGILDMSGIKVAGQNAGEAFFALAPGHSLPHYGSWDIQPNLLLASQEQVITLAGLYRSWRNNPFKSIPLVFDAPIGLIDCFPNQKCTISIASADNVRGWQYNGGLIPTSVALVHDPDTGYLHTEATFEAETGESQAIQGDTPGSGDVSGPVTPSFPPLSFPPIIIPGLPEPTAVGPKTVLFHDVAVGLILATNFDTTPEYVGWNTGLPAGWGPRINWMWKCQNGAIYVAYVASAGTNPSFIARAPSAGASFEIQFRSDVDGILWTVGGNANVSEGIAYIAGPQPQDGTGHIYIGANGAYTQGAALSGLVISPDGLSYGFGKWLYTRFNGYLLFNPNGSVAGSGTYSGLFTEHLRAGSTSITFHPRGAVVTSLHRSDDNLTNLVEITTPFNTMNRASDCDPTGTYLCSPYSGKIKSGDGGYTWSGISSLPPGNWCFAYAGTGDSPTAPRFIAAGAVVRYTPDFWASIINKENASLTSIVAFPNINRVLVLEE